MKLKTSIILCSVATAFSGVAIANPVVDFYAGATIGVGAQTVFYDGTNTTDSAQSFGALIGMDVPFFRIDAEYNYLHQADNYAHLALVNAYFKMPSAIIKPYIGAGVGILFDGKDKENDITFDTCAAYQGTLGITLDVPVLPFKFDIEGRALYVPDIVTINGEKPDVLHYDARVKIRYVF